MPLLNRLSIQSKLILMLLSVTLTSIFVIAAIGYISGRDAMYQAVRSQLIGIRTARAQQIQASLATIRKEVITLADDETTVNALKAFRAGFDSSCRPHCSGE